MEIKGGVEKNILKSSKKKKKKNVSYHRLKHINLTKRRKGKKKALHSLLGLRIVTTSCVVKNKKKGGKKKRNKKTTRGEIRRENAREDFIVKIGEKVCLIKRTPTLCRRSLPRQISNAATLANVWWQCDHITKLDWRNSIEEGDSNLPFDYKQLLSVLMGVYNNQDCKWLCIHWHDLLIGKFMGMKVIRSAEVFIHAC